MPKFTLYRPAHGFTLIELIIVIVILAILATLGFNYYNGMQANAKDSKRKADVNALYKAYTTNVKNGLYQPLKSSQFMAGQVPQTPEGTDYTCVTGPSDNCTTQSNDKFVVCTGLGNQAGTPCSASSSTCYCQSSTQNTPPLASGGSGSGGSGGNNPPCDPTGSLTSGLVGYWKMNESSWNGTAGEVIDSTGNGSNGTAVCIPDTPTSGCNTPQISTNGKFGNAGSFENTGAWDASYLEFGATSNAINSLTDFTYSTWVNFGRFTDWDNIRLITKYNTTSTKTKALQISAGFADPFASVSASGGSAQSNTDETNSQSVLILNQWQLLTMTYTGSTDRKIRLYINGNEAVYDWQTAALGPAYADDALRMGKNSYVDDRYLMDDVRMYNRALPLSEIQLLYNNGQGCVQ